MEARDVPGGDLETLLRWERAGGTWRLDRPPGERDARVQVTLCRCDGGEEPASAMSWRSLDRLVSADPVLVAYVIAAVIEDGEAAEAGLGSEP